MLLGSRVRVIVTETVNVSHYGVKVGSVIIKLLGGYEIKYRRLLNAHSPYFKVYRLAAYLCEIGGAENGGSGAVHYLIRVEGVYGNAGHPPAQLCLTLPVQPPAGGYVQSVVVLLGVGVPEARPGLAAVVGNEHVIHYRPQTKRGADNVLRVVGIDGNPAVAVGELGGGGYLLPGAGCNIVLLYSTHSGVVGAYLVGPGGVKEPVGGNLTLNRAQLVAAAGHLGDGVLHLLPGSTRVVRTVEHIAAVSRSAHKDSLCGLPRR